MREKENNYNQTYIIRTFLLRIVRIIGFRCPDKCSYKFKEKLNPIYIFFTVGVHIIETPKMKILERWDVALLTCILKKLLTKRASKTLNRAQYCTFNACSRQIESLRCVYRYFYFIKLYLFKIHLHKKLTVRHKERKVAFWRCEINTKNL